LIELAFLICALALPSANFNRPSIVSWHAVRNEEDALRDGLRKHPEIDDVFITPEGTEDTLRDHGWSKAPFSINGKQVWIHRKPKSDQKYDQKLLEAA
jgi:hypothetical protein